MRERAPNSFVPLEETVEATEAEATVADEEYGYGEIPDVQPSGSRSAMTGAGTMLLAGSVLAGSVIGGPPAAMGQNLSASQQAYTIEQPYRAPPRAELKVPAQQRQTAAPPVQSATPGLDAVKRTPRDESGVAQVVEIVRAHSNERDEILAWVQRHRSREFVQNVTWKMGQIEHALPEDVDIHSVRASMIVPGGRKLAGGLFQGYSIKTTYPTVVNVEVTPVGIRVWANPGIYLDANWPLRDCTVNGAALTFGTNQPRIDISDGGGVGVIGIQGHVTSKITEMLQQALAGTKLVEPDYSPIRDTDLQKTLDKVLQGFVDVFAGAEHGEGDKQPSIAPEEMTRVSAGATFSISGGTKFLDDDGSGIEITSSAPIRVTVDGAGNLGDLTKAGDAQTAASQAKVQSVLLETDGLHVISGGKPIAKLESLRLSHGGAITIERMRPLGKAADARAVEGGLSGLLALYAIAARDPAANDLVQNAHNPKLVDAITRNTIEQRFTDEILKLILAYRSTVPGVDLADTLGIK